MIDVEKLRRDYMTAARWLVEIGEWTGDKSQQVGEEIKVALDFGNKQKLSAWAEWLSLHADLARTHQAEMDRLNREAVAYVTQQRGCA